MTDDSSAARASPGNGSEATDSPSDTDLSMLMSSATIVIVGQVLYSVSTLLERVIVANALSPDAYAQVGIGLSVLLIGSTVGQAGLAAGITRFASRFDDDADVRGVFVTGVGIVAAVSAALTAVLYWRVDLLASYLLDGGEGTALLRLFVLAIPFVAVFNAAVAAIRGMENTIYSTYAKQLVYPGVRLVLLAGLLALGWGVAAAGYAYLLAAAVTGLVAFALLGRLVPLRGAFHSKGRELLAFSAPLLLSGVVSLLLSRADTLLVGYFRTNIEVAQYEAAWPLASGLQIVMSSFGFMYLPLISRFDSEDRIGAIDGVYKLTTKWIYLLTFPLFLVLFVFPADVLRIVFSPEYASGWAALSVLSVGFLSQAVTGRCTETLSALGYTRTIFGITAGTFLLNIALNLLLIPRYGFVAAAATSAVSFAIENAVTVVVLWRWFGITPLSRLAVRTFLVLPIVLLPPAVLLSREITLSMPSLVALAAVSPLATLAVYLFAGCAEPEDRIAIDIVEERIGRPVPFADRLFSDRDE